MPTAPYVQKAWELGDGSLFAGSLKRGELNCTVDNSESSDYVWFPPGEFWFWVLCYHVFTKQTALRSI